MKTLLLLGGMTPDVTVLYYNTINRIVRAHYGGSNAASLYLYSANISAMLQHANAGDWPSFARAYTDPITALTARDGPAARVDGVVVCAILSHKVSRELTAALAPSGAPLLHIADFLAAYVKARYPWVKRLGLLGPKITMLGAEDPDFFMGRLQSAGNGFAVIIPQTEQDMNDVNRGMMEEVVKGAAAVTDATKAMFVRQAKKLVERGAQVIVLGSTDLGFVLHQEDIGGNIPVIEPALVHAEGVAKWACEEIKHT